MTVLSNRAANRATLDRQLLLRRADLSVLDAVEHLVGLQAQAPFPPYTGLWTRLADFRPPDLADRLLDRSVVRIALMRGTVHLVSAADCLALRPLHQDMLERVVRTAYRRHLDGLEFTDIAEYGRALVEQKPRSTAELGTLLLERWPGRDRQAMLNVIRSALPLVQLPPRAVWGRSGQTTVTTAQSWLDRPLCMESTLDGLVRRYLAAFGPATVADAQKWSGLTRLGEVFDRLRPELITFRAENGTELFDLPDAPRPGPDAEAPVRFLPDFDNILLAYADPSRIMPPGHKAQLFTVNGIIRAALLVDGQTVGKWQITTAARSTTLTVEAFRRLSTKDKAAIEAEGTKLIRFTEPEAGEHAVRIVPVANQAPDRCS
jgi:hypothetical protein